MATAPRPGAHRQQAAATEIFRVTVRGETLEFLVQLTLQEAFAVRNATGGMSFEALRLSPGRDTLVVVWWLARRRNGMPNVSLAAIDAELGGITGDDFEVEIVSDDGEPTDDPEG